MLPYERLEKYLTEEERQRVHDSMSKGLAEGRNQGLAEGRNQGLAEALFRALQGRGLEISNELRARIAQKTSDELLAMVGRSGVVTRAEDLFE